MGVGLDSAELGWPPQLYTDVFTLAGELGFKRMAHAGGRCWELWKSNLIIGCATGEQGLRSSVMRAATASC